MILHSKTKHPERKGIKYQGKVRNGENLDHLEITTPPLFDANVMSNMCGVQHDCGPVVTSMITVRLYPP